MPNTSFLYGQFLETVGIELEGEGLLRSSLSDLLVSRLSNIYDPFPVVVTRDASTECNVNFISPKNSTGRKMLELYTHAKLSNIFSSRSDNILQYGYELVINPTTIEDLKNLVFDVENVLISAGDFTTDRSATHFHIGFAHNLRYLKRLLAVCLNIDPLLYRLGGMGRTYRGHSNNSAYARPLLNSPAVPIGLEVRVSSRRNPSSESRTPSRFSPELTLERERNNRGYVQIINPLRALEAKTTADFWSCFGVFPDIVGLGKYHASRYMGCNFYALTQHGTMEFRHFNQSHDYELIYTIAKFLRAVVEMAVNLTKSEVVDFYPVNPNQQIDMGEAENIMDTLQKYFRVHGIEEAPTDSEMVYLLDVMEKSSFSAIDETPVLTHKSDFFIPSNLAYNLTPLKTMPLPPTHVEIHNISQKHSSILGDYK